MSELEIIRQELVKRKGTWKTIEADTGVPYDFLHRFAAGKAKRPPYEYVATLEKYLYPKRPW